jgi:uncharacterized protein YecE (DUF72 family)
MAALYAGTSGWAYASWKPAFYPAKLASAKFLQFYATRLNTVEVNYSFRHYLTEKTLNGWIAGTPENFKFSIKAHQRITHIKKLREAAEDARSFLASLQLLSESQKLGMVLFQLPPYLKADLVLLDEFLAGMRRAAPFAFEFRHASWFTDGAFETLRKHGAAICVAETEDLETPDVRTADFCYYRLRKPEYTAEERKGIVEKIQGRLGEGCDVFVYFKHEDTPQGALYAEELLGAVTLNADQSDGAKVGHFN